ncbi:hypothetical protein [Bacillus sp. Bos-x628]|uniref:hypothetical protein n=1 Tax=Bacillus maqinnsis TaxID=3229854 RepID=UPI0033906B79
MFKFINQFLLFLIYLTIPIVLIHYGVLRTFNYDIDFWGIYFILIASFFLKSIF